MVGNSRKRRFDDEMSSSSSFQPQSRRAVWEPSSSSSSSTGALRYEYKIELHIPDSKIGYIIGKGGEMISRLQATMPDVCIFVEESTEDPRKVILRGHTQEALEFCKRRIIELMKIKDANLPYLPYLKALSPFMTQIEVPREHIGYVIGKQGKTINRIKEQYGTLSHTYSHSTSPVVYTRSH